MVWAHGLRGAGRGTAAGRARPRSSRGGSRHRRGGATWIFRGQVTALLRLEFDAPGRSVAAERRRLTEAACAGVDYRLVSASLGFELLFVLIARHLVDLVGRRPTVAGLAAAAGAGALALATPEYVPSWDAAPEAALVAALASSRGALSAAVATTILYAAETNVQSARAASAAVAAVAARLGGLGAAAWVRRPGRYSKWGRGVARTDCYHTGRLAKPARDGVAARHARLRLVRVGRARDALRARAPRAVRARRAAAARPRAGSCSGARALAAARSG